MKLVKLSVFFSASLLLMSGYSVSASASNFFYISESVMIDIGTDDTEKKEGYPNDFNYTENLFSNVVLVDSNLMCSFIDGPFSWVRYHLPSGRVTCFEWR